jgi:putative Mg2+ transporter-C (MgtC) family protein
MHLPEQDQALRLLLALLLGSVVGFERQRLSHAAGLRTHALVSVGAALVIIVSEYGFSDVVNGNGVVLDPSRVAAQVVSGIGFLGAGTIIVARATVRGLTTAASIWAVAGIGLACGSGLYFAASFATLMVLFVLVPLKMVEERLFPRPAVSEPGRRRRRKPRRYTRTPD